MFYFSHLLCDEEMRDVIRNTGMGVESIDFSIAENLDNLDTVLKSYEKRLEWMECRDLIVHGPFLDLNPISFDDQIRRVTMKRYEEAYTAAKKLGAKKIVYHTCLVPDWYLLIGWADRMADFYRELLEDKDDSIEVVMENVLDRIPDAMVETAEKINHPAFGLCLDVGHAHCYSEIPCEEWRKMQEPYLKHLHVHDNFQNKDSHLAFGTGIIPKQVIAQALKDHKGRTCTIECSNFEAVMASYKTLKEISTAAENGRE